jgi:MYXO-CTERM domain-containing protein
VVDGDCDVAESCDGTTAICPTDIFKSSSDVCRPAAGECDAEETCSGVDKSCPADQHQPDGTTCTGGTCKAGACVPVGDAGPLPEAGVDAGADVGPREAGADATPSEAGTGDAAAGDAAAGDAGPDTGVRCFGPTCEEPDDGCGCRVANPPGRPFELPALLLLLVFGFVLRRRAR